MTPDKRRNYIFLWNRKLKKHQWPRKPALNPSLLSSDLKWVRCGATKMYHSRRSAMPWDMTMSHISLFIMSAIWKTCLMDTVLLWFVVFNHTDCVLMVSVTTAIVIPKSAPQLLYTQRCIAIFNIKIIFPIRVFHAYNVWKCNFIFDQILKCIDLCASLYCQQQHVESVWLHCCCGEWEGRDTVNRCNHAS